MLALRGGRPVVRYLDRLSPQDAPSRVLRLVAPRVNGVEAERHLVAKIGGAVAGLAASSAIALAFPIGPALVIGAAYLGWILPSVHLDRRLERRRSAADRATVVLVERAEALVAAGRPAETAIALLLTHPTGSPLLNSVMRRVADSYQLGAPLFRTLAAEATREGLVTCAATAEALERSRDLGRGSLSVLQERRAALRAAERARALEAASHVEGRMMLVLVLCYLPALMLLVVIPLFIGLLDALGA